MISNKLPNWTPSFPPIYDITRSYLNNLEEGPFFNHSLPERIFPPEEKWVDFLGYAVASRLGVPAGPLLSSKWVTLAANLGFDITTYKTIRSQVHPCHPLPNMIYVDTQGILEKEHLPEAVHYTHKPSAQLETLAVTNSFGMPSMSPAFLKEDIAKANASLHKGQVMVVSVVGTPRSNCTFTEDFIAAALLAKDSGAKIIEANFSCPNVDRGSGALYTSAQTVFDLGHALVKAISNIPLIIKVGAFVDYHHMSDVMEAAAKAGIRSISGINTVSLPVIDDQGRPALGPQRLTSGICGGPIRSIALDFITHAARINHTKKLGLTLIGVGGITLAEHFDQFFSAGADFAMSATGMMWDPYLAMRYFN